VSEAGATEFDIGGAIEAVPLIGKAAGAGAVRCVDTK
jgi:hypothetical protein